MLPPRHTETNEQNFEISIEYVSERREPITDEYVIDFECKLLLCKFQHAQENSKTRSKKRVCNAFLVVFFRKLNPLSEKNSKEKEN